MDYEAILGEEKLPGVTIIEMNLRSPESFSKRVRLLEYILDKKDEALGVYRLAD